MQLVLLAVIPALIIIFYVNINDKYDKEPKHLLVFSFLMGAIISILFASVLYLLTQSLVPFQVIEKQSVWQLFIKAFFMVGFIEEFSKYIIVRYYAQPKREFNEQFDGIIYAVMVSMGFATTENVMYVFEGGLQTALLRMFTAVPAHATFAVIMGYFLGKAKFSQKKTYYNLVGLLSAIFFHGAYDFFLFLDFIPGIWLGAFVSLFLGLYLSKKAMQAHSDNSRFK